MKIVRYPEKTTWQTLCVRPSLKSLDAKNTAREILTSIQSEGLPALLRYAQQLDGLTRSSLRVEKHELELAASLVDSELRLAISRAAEAIKLFHESQRSVELPQTTWPGVTCWRRTVPVQQVGLYIPGGSAPLFSTALMLGVPARVAGCKRIVICTPPQRDGTIAPGIACVAQLLAIDEVYLVGGAQAIGLLAYGAGSIERVDKIYGPGNSYVTAAKEIVAGEGVAIDLPAGPSELLIIGDSESNPEYIAADLLSQAEHGPTSQVVLVTTSETLVDRVMFAVERRCRELPRATIATEALMNSLAIIVPSLDEAITFSNLYAPEHLSLALRSPEPLLSQIVNAGSVFVGNLTPEAAGDYASGTNHTLPTGGYARASGGVSLDSFLKKITFQQITEEGVSAIASTVVTMARAEGLEAHAQAMIARVALAAKESI
jgi:histidinol dehydrogenase